MTLFVMAYCNKISVLQILLSGYLFIYLCPVLKRRKTFLKGQLLVFFVLHLEVLKHLAF